MTVHYNDDAVDVAVARETMARTFARWDDVATLDRPGAWAQRVALNLATGIAALVERARRNGQVRPVTRPQAPA